MDGYDLDDTLADTDFDQADTIGLPAVFGTAEVNYRPTEPFVVITARPNANAAQRNATESWLVDNFGDLYKGTYYVSGSEQQIIEGKARKIEELNLKSFTDNNEMILAALKELLPPSVALYRLEDGQRIRA